ncbi:MAG: hypothetical protein ACI9S7_001301 [Candidatus Paceibacteria bacterium]|jgi:hypothetical protein|tara:strand:+ start:595 stop:1437 length:843 start_codon:yes stop_codon:yes gene_type:complete
MFNTNPFAELSAMIDPSIMQVYVIIMALLVAGGTLFDVVHKRSAKYFFNNWQKSKANAKRQVSGSERASVAVKTAIDGLTSAELGDCSTRRQLAHLLTMYGFIAYTATTAMMVFGYQASATPAIVANLWYLGAFMVCLGGYWFWFFIRVDVSAEGHSPFRLVRADLFVVSLTLSTTFALVWAYTQVNGSSTWTMLSLIVYIFTTTVLFGSVPWSKFSHMFFKPAAALEKKMSEANGSRNNLPEPVDRTNPAIRDSHSMELLKDAPLSMGLGIKREKPSHY